VHDSDSAKQASACAINNFSKLLLVVIGYTGGSKNKY
jgi:hypothetical protein